MNPSRHALVPGRPRRRARRVGAVLAAAAVASAVGGGVGAASPQSGEPVTVRWFVGLGTGAEVEQLQAQEDLVAEFNDSQDAIELQIEIVDNEVASDTLATQIAAGDAPDIIGPIGIRGSNYFAGNFLDLEPLVESTGFDLSGYDEAQVEFWREDDGALTALPFGVFPAVLYYNTDLFDEAGLEPPPAAYGEPYADGDPWDMDKLAELAKVLTVDANGNDATSPDFDPANVVQWGFHHQFNDDARAIGSFFQAGSLVADDGTTAQIPEAWVDSWQWYVDLIAAGAAPNQSQIDSDTLQAGNAFNTGNVAMAFSHLWYTCCVRDDEGVGREFWNLAAVPEYNGEATAKLHADTFRILDSTENPEAAFERSSSTCVTWRSPSRSSRRTRRRLCASRMDASPRTTWSSTALRSTGLLRAGSSTRPASSSLSEPLRTRRSRGCGVRRRSRSTSSSQSAPRTTVRRLRWRGGRREALLSATSTLGLSSFSSS